MLKGGGEREERGKVKKSSGGVEKEGKEGMYSSSPFTSSLSREKKKK